MLEIWRGKKIFVLKIVWESGEGEINVFENDEPCLLADEFVNKHGLDQDFVRCIEIEIEQKIDWILKGNVGEKPQKIVDDTMKVASGLRFSDMKLGESSAASKEFGRTFNSLSPSRLRVRQGQKVEQYKKIFKFLNPDNFGKIYSNRVFQLNLKHKICKILMPILIDIDSLHLSIGFNEFCQKMDVLVNYLSESDIEFLMKFQIDLKVLNHVKEKEFMNARCFYSP